MRRFLSFGLLCLFAAIPVRAQVCSGDLTLSSQAEVDAFACTDVIGDFRISGADIADLAPLSSLTYLDGSLRITDNDVLPSLAGLENLGYLEGSEILIENNASLVSIAALGGLTSIDLSGFIVRGNPVLEALADLEPLTQADRCFINNNDALVSLAGLEALATAGRLFILNNASLESLAGLDNLTGLGWHLRIEDNAALASLAGLEGLLSVGFGLFSPGDVRIINNPSLETLAGLESLTSIGRDLRIIGNDALVSLDGLESLSYVEEDLRIIDNDALETLAGLESLDNLVIDLIVEDNDALHACSCGLEGIISGSPPAFTNPRGSITIGGNDPDGTCTSPAAVLVNSCTPQGSFDLVAQVSDLDPAASPGGSVPFVYTVTNTTANPVSGDLWFTTSPGGQTGVILSGTVAAGARVGASFVQNVPGSTAPGTYSYTLNIGQFPDVVEDSVTFSITVTGSAYATGVEAWTVGEARPWLAAEGGDALSLAQPEAFALDAAYPNPFATTTTVGFALPNAADVRVAVYDVLGREVAVLVDEALEAGRHTLAFEARGLASGVYVVRMAAGGFADMQRVTLVR